MECEPISSAVSYAKKAPACYVYGRAKVPVRQIEKPTLNIARRVA